MLFLPRNIIQIALQDKGCRGGIVAGITVGLPDPLNKHAGGHRRETLITILYGDFDETTQFIHEQFCFLRLLALGAVHIQRQTGNDMPDFIFTDNISNLLNSGRLISPIDNGQRSSQDTQRVAEG